MIPEIPVTHWLFFYSRNGVKYFLESMGDGALRSLSERKIACMGYGTAEELRLRAGVESDFIGKGGPLEVANQFIEKLSSRESILFLTAADSKHSVEKILKDSYTTRNIPVYGNDIIEDITIKEVDHVIITSPKNGVSFNKYYNYPAPRNIIAIGKTTALKLHKLGYKNIIVSTTPDERGMVEALKIVS